ncbi:hypothetical protein BGW41_001162 [Actinomortierella wolfii]|nr:hypothetical protein BGW41_001162 [Actinomortierella wolfii]
MPVDIIDIPEIQQSIACHLGIHDLASGVLVNKAWNAAFLPYLWHSIYVEAAFLDKLYAPIPLSPLQRISRRLRHIVPGVTSHHSVFSTGISNVRNHNGSNSSWRYYSGTSSAFRTPSAFFLETLKRRGHHIRQLTMFRWDDIPIMSPFCRHLTSLSMTIHRSEHCWPATLELVKANENLSKLSITMAGSDHISSGDQIELLTLLPKLKVLEMTNYQGRTGVDLILRLLTVCPQLRVLRLKTNIAPEGASDDFALNTTTAEASSASNRTSGSSNRERCKTVPTPLCSSLTSLQELELAVYNTRELQHNYLLPWLKHCPTLTYFKLPDLMAGRVSELCTLFQHHLHYIEKLDLSHLHFLEDENFAALIEACSSYYRQGVCAPPIRPSQVDAYSSSRRGISNAVPITDRHQYLLRRPVLRELMLECCSIGLHTVNAILTHHRDTLEVLNIKRCREQFKSEWIQALLVNCTALRVFESGQSVGYPMIVTLSAQDMYQSRWGCTKLEVLQLSITGICRHKSKPSAPVLASSISSPPSSRLPPLTGSPKQDQDAAVHQPSMNIAAEESSECENHDHLRCMAIQADVYEQLGQLRQLRRLDLGRMGKSWASEDQQRLEEKSSLEWTLSSGMNRGKSDGTSDDGGGALTQLSRLEELGIAWIQHSLGTPELEWMKRHWPRLSRVIGDERWVQRQPEVRAWVAEHWPKLQLVCRNSS